jgi:hypothetical protein
VANEFPGTIAVLDDNTRIGPSNGVEQLTLPPIIDLNRAIGPFDGVIFIILKLLQVFPFDPVSKHQTMRCSGCYRRFLCGCPMTFGKDKELGYLVQNVASRRTRHRGSLHRASKQCESVPPNGSMIVRFEKRQQRRSLG